MVEKRLYLIKDGELWFSDQVLVVDGDDFKRKALHAVHLGDKTTRISELAFEGNYLKQVHFHQKMKFIESKAFLNNKIEKLIFSRLEVPQIEKDAFIGNPIDTIIVPYETYPQYCKMLENIEFDQEPVIISNILMKFIKLNETDTEDTLIIVKAKPVYGEYIWRIEKEEIVDFETKMNKDESQFDFGNIIVDGIEYRIFKDDRHNVIFYHYENGHYFDVTFEEFEKIYKEVTNRKDIL